MPGLPTGTVTFLFTDIEGSTELVQRLGDRRYAEVLEEHHRLLRDAFAKGKGQEINIQGDAILVAFSRARDAVAAAVAAQQAIGECTWPNGASLRVRMGLHTGEPLSGAPGYVGLDVHRAARICSAGHGGQILLSDAVSVLAARDLPPGVTLRDLGTHRLKDLQQPEHLLQVVHPDLPGDFPPLKSLDARPNNLPRQLTSFIGREKEMAEVKRLISGANIVTLTGSGGAGKTRLALQVAADVVEGYPDGVWLAEFAPITDPALVPKIVASALNVPEQPGRNMTDTLVDALRPKALLLLLDNCEHLLAACRDLAATLLRRCSQTCILATSREGLGVPGEILWRVPSLSVPEDISHLPGAEELILYDAVRLFVDRAVATNPEFLITGENAAAVAQVCERLDGIPLAIELAAARVKVLAVEQIAARLDDRFRLLTGGSPTLLPRQQTLRATLDWSYGLLSNQERTVLRRLSVFAGGWTLEAAEAVCAANGIEVSGILDLLTQLVDKSLVVAETRGGEARYRLLETVRQYGDEKLQIASERTEVRQRHREWFLALAEQAEPELFGPKQGMWMDRLETEHDNLRAAFAWTMTEANGRQLGLRLAAALAVFWNTRGDWGEGLEWLEEGLNGDEDGVLSTRAKALAWAAGFAWKVGQDKQAIALAEKGQAVCREVGDREHGALCLYWLGNVAMQRGDYACAKRFDEESLSLCSESKNKAFTGLALNDLGEVTRYQGNYEQAIALHEQSLSLARDSGYMLLTANALRHLGMDHLRRGDYGLAADCYRQSLHTCTKTRIRWVPVECLNGLGDLACVEQHYERAARLFGAASKLREMLGLRPVPPDQEYHDKHAASVRAQLGASAFAAAWAEGHAMTLEQAIEYALAVEAG